MHFFLWGGGGGGGGRGGVFWRCVNGECCFRKAERLRLVFSILLIIYKENRKDIGIFTSYLIDRIGVLDSRL